MGLWNGEPPRNGRAIFADGFKMDEDPGTGISYPNPSISS